LIVEHELLFMTCPQQIWAYRIIIPKN